MARRLTNAFLLTVLVSSMAYAATDGTQTFSGYFRWDAQNLSANLEAVFTPTGEATWDVSFNFQFQGSHTFSGTAEGSLKNGKLEGTVLNERETRSFDFRGSIKRGKFRAVHFESTGGARRRTGTLSMKVKD